MVPKLLQDCIPRCGLNSKKVCAGVQPVKNSLYYIRPDRGNKMVKKISTRSNEFNLSQNKPFSENNRTQLNNKPQVI